MRSARATCVVLAALLLTGLSSPALAGTIRHDVPERIPELLGRFYPNVGLVDSTFPQGDVTPSIIGSGTLIARDWVLTAAHVIDWAEDPPEVTFGRKTYTADLWVSHPLFNPDDLPALGVNPLDGYDIGLIHLDSPVKRIRPATLYRGDGELGHTATIAGFGLHGNGLDGEVLESEWDGKRRAGMNTLDSVYGEDPETGRIILIDFDSPGHPEESTLGSPKPLPLEYCPARGDSGGPLFVGRRLVGVTSFLWPRLDSTYDSDYGDQAGFMRIAQPELLSWIDATVQGAEGPTGPWHGHGPGDGCWSSGDATDLDILAAERAAPTFLSVPEPATIGLLALGALAIVRRRRR